MTQTMTLLQVRNLAYAAADMSGSTTSDGLVPVAEANAYVNASLAELNGLLVRNDVSFYLTSTIVTVPSGQTGFALPSQVTPNSTGNGNNPVDFMAMMGLDRSGDSTGSPQSFFSVHPLTHWDERNLGNNTFYVPAYQPVIRYRIIGNSVQLFPPLNAPGTYRLWWYPDSPTLVNDTDTFDNQRYWGEYVRLDVAIKMLAKEESDASTLMAQKDRLIETILLMGSDRDLSAPKVAGRRGNGSRTRGNGNDGGFWF